jgi:hypothetical protein
MEHPNSGDHARHDALLVAGHAAGDLTGIDRARADAVIAGCEDCAELRRDLVALAAATRSARAPATRIRDLRLSDEQADRLRRGSWLRTFLRPFASATSPIRPIAAAFTSLGIVGLLVGVTLTGGPAAPLFTAASGDSGVRGAAASAGAAADPKAQGAEGGDGFEAQRTAAIPAPAVSEPIAVARASSAARDNQYDTATGGPRMTSVAPGSTEAAVVGDADADKGDTTTGGVESTPAPAVAQTTSPLIAGSLALLGIGLLLFGLRLASRRVR